jgi:hypothetical protein
MVSVQAQRHEVSLMRRFAPASANTPPYRDETAKGWGTRCIGSFSVWATARFLPLVQVRLVHQHGDFSLDQLHHCCVAEPLFGVVHFLRLRGQLGQ